MNAERRGAWVGAVVVLAALAAVSLGGYGVSSTLEEPAGDPVGFDGLAVQPLSGWTAAGGGEVGGWRFFRLTRGTGNLDVAVRRAPSTSAAGAAIQYVDEVLRRSLVRLTVSERLEPVMLQSGEEGVRFSYAGVVSDTAQSIEGQVTVVASGLGGVAFDAWTLAGQLPFVLDDVQVMLEEATIGAGSGL